MAVPRNAPCPCGSGNKAKRCCEAQRRDEAARTRHDERVGRNAEAWAFDEHGQELRAAGANLRAGLADHPQSAWIVEHAVILDHELHGGGTAAERYAALPELPDADREAAARIAVSRIGIFRVVESRRGESIDLDDLLRGGGVSVASAGVSRQARGGDLLLARVMNGSPPSLWGPVRVYERRRASTLLDELGRLPYRDRPEELRHAWPRLMTLPLPIRAPVLAHAAWDIDDAEEALDLLPDALEHDGEEDGADVFLWRVGDRPDDYGGHLELYADGLVLRTYDESLLDEAIALISSALGTRARLAEREVRRLTLPRAGEDHHRRAA